MTISGSTSRAVYDAIEAGVSRDDLARVVLIAALKHFVRKPLWIVKAEMLESSFYAETVRLIDQLERCQEKDG